MDGMEILEVKVIGWKVGKENAWYVVIHSLWRLNEYSGSI